MSEKKRILHVGIDDTDSKKGMCTTYVGAVVKGELEKIGVKIVGLPKLVRLNPACPFKTRGNCSVAMTLEVSDEEIPMVKKIVLEKVGELAELKVETTNPGVVFYKNKEIPPEVRAFSKKVVREIVKIEDAEKIADEIGADLHKFKVGRGIIGALAAIGNVLEEDRTFELIAYRTPENRGRPRKIDAESVLAMNSKIFPETFDNLDPSTGEIRITPHTPCPILYGIRGESVSSVESAQKIVKAGEPIERMVIYMTNQGTDEHLRKAKISEIKPFWSVSVKGKVSSSPKIIPGGHVIFNISDETGKIDCAAYEPTRQFRDVAKNLAEGDVVIAHGGVKEKPEIPLTINLEKIEILALEPKFLKRNPKCSKCSKRMKSEGRMKGYSCVKCGIKAPQNSVETVPVDRRIDVGKYEVPPRARRHLARPLVREYRVKPQTLEF